ncbi:MAG: HepT-like ribonuclease domain-containing protein [Gammaproteobacteria bacterium]
MEERPAATADALRADPDRQDILSLNITRAVQLCVDLAMGDAFDLLAAEGVISVALCKRMRGAVGFCNIAVPSYQAIDWDIVHAITLKVSTTFASSRLLSALNSPPDHVAHRPR